MYRVLRKPFKLQTKKTFQEGDIVTEKDLEAIKPRKRENTIRLYLEKGWLERVDSSVTHLIAEPEGTTLTVDTSNEKEFVIPDGIERKGPWYFLPNGEKVKGIKALKEALGV